MKIVFGKNCAKHGSIFFFLFFCFSVSVHSRCFFSFFTSGFVFVLNFCSHVIFFSIFCFSFYVLCSLSLPFSVSVLVPGIHPLATLGQAHRKSSVLIV